MILPIYVANTTLAIHEKRDVIKAEAGILNSILGSEWFLTYVRIYQIKINVRNIDVYELPIKSKLFIQPFTLDRDVYE